MRRHAAECDLCPPSYAPLPLCTVPCRNLPLNLHLARRGSPPTAQRHHSGDAAEHFADLQILRACFPLSAQRNPICEQQKMRAVWSRGMELRYGAAAQNFADIRPRRADLLPYRQCRAYLRGQPLPTAIDKTAKNENAINKNSAEKNIRRRSLLGAFSAACRPPKRS